MRCGTGRRQDLSGQHHQQSQDYALVLELWSPGLLWTHNPLLNTLIVSGKEGSP